MKNEPVPLKKYSPETLFPAARDEVIFGSGRFTIGLPAKRAVMLMNTWALFFVEHKLGELFTPTYGSHFRTSLIISRSSKFKDLVQRAGYTPEALSLPLNEEAQRTVLRQLAAVCQNKHLNLQEP